MKVGQVVTFDGHTINDYFRVGVVDAPPPSFEPNLLSKPRGATLKSRRYGTSTITVPLVAKHMDDADVRDLIDALLSWLDVDGERMLSLSQDMGRTRKVVVGGLTIDDAEWEDVLTLTFEQTDPYLYGDRMAATIPVGQSSVTIDVGGSAPTMLSVSCASVSSASNVGYLWQLTDELGNSMAAKVDGTARPLSIDCDERVVVLSNATTTITLDTDWMRLSPGEHAISLTAGSFGAPIGLSWIERWHR